METQIEFIKGKIKDLEWSKNYHANKILETQIELDAFQKALDEQQEKIAHEILM